MLKKGFFVFLSTNMVWFEAKLTKYMCDMLISV